jgi:hypothetical protein
VGVYGSVRVDAPVQPEDMARGPRGARSRAVYRADENVEGVQEAGRKTRNEEGHAHAHAHAHAQSVTCAHVLALFTLAY